MVAAFVLIAIGGIVMGFSLRVVALVGTSLLVMAFSIASSVASGRGFLSALAVTFGLLAVLQAAYLAGLLLNNLLKARKDSRDAQYPNPTMT